MIFLLHHNRHSSFADHEQLFLCREDDCLQVTYSNNITEEVLIQYILTCPSGRMKIAVLIRWHNFQCYSM